MTSPSVVQVKVVMGHASAPVAKYQPPLEPASPGLARPLLENKGREANP